MSALLRRRAAVQQQLAQVLESSLAVPCASSSARTSSSQASSAPPREQKEASGAGKGAPRDHARARDLLSPAQRAAFPAEASRSVWSKSYSSSAAQEALVDVPEAYQDHTFSVDEFGAVSLSREEAAVSDEKTFKNIDGKRYNDGRYDAFINRIKREGVVDEKRIISDPVRTFAYGTDASFYRLNPKYVIKVSCEEEVAKILPMAKELGVPVTFRAAGTSLSGQAITDSVLLKLSHMGRAFRNYEIKEGGKEITVQPGLIGGEVNRLLARYKHIHKLKDQYKIGPDPASIDSCMIGGIVSNNSSGMCCGVAKNSYNTVKDLRVVFMDGTILDTSVPESVESFKRSHPHILEGLSAIARKTQADAQLTALIRKKFSIKCTTGYSINALVDVSPEKPIEILKKVMIGSEGTLGFISQVTFKTVPELPDKASCFVLFPDIRDACRAAHVLRDNTDVAAVEMFDRASLKEFECDDKMLGLVKGLDRCGDHAASLLIEVNGDDDADLEIKMKEVMDQLCTNFKVGPSPEYECSTTDYPFTKKAEEYNVYWNARKGLIPVVGGARQVGTSMLIEDVACSVDNLGNMSVDLIEMFKKFEYNDATVFGHALEGNLHLVFSQGFRTADEVVRFDEMMQEMAYIVADKYGGSLKAEHGTGRNVAPFVEMEWGTQAYDIMWELKSIFEPDNMLNPGVILNNDPDIHMKSLKQSPPANDLVNRCIECGFCESNCPSRDLSLTPRQRITVYREISRLRAIDDRSPQEQERMEQMTEAFDYLGMSTCAADGMCQEKCPVKINTGELIKTLRTESMPENANALANLAANNFGAINATVPPLLNAVNLAHKVFGASVLETTSKLLNKVSGNMVPVWNKYMPRGAAKLDVSECVESPDQTVPKNAVVYMPSCVTRMMGPSASDETTGAAHEKMISILKKGGYDVIVPKGVNSMCCGMMFESRGNKPAAQAALGSMEATLKDLSMDGRIPIICDTSPCTQTIKNNLENKMLGLSLYEPVEFIHNFLMDKLEFEKVKSDVAIHVPCSSKKMGVESKFVKVAEMCADNVHQSGIPCCGMAGDRGMRFTELTGSSLQHLDVPKGCCDGYSTSRTCEMSLSNHSGVDFRGLVYLVDEATKAKEQAAAS